MDSSFFYLSLSQLEICIMGAAAFHVSISSIDTVHPFLSLSFRFPSPLFLPLSLPLPFSSFLYLQACRCPLATRPVGRGGQGERRARPATPTKPTRPTRALHRRGEVWTKKKAAAGTVARAAGAAGVPGMVGRVGMAGRGKGGKRRRQIRRPAAMMGE